MKKKILTLFCVILLFTISACGQKGDDGDIYLRIKLYDPVTGYWDNNSAIPYGFSQDSFYNSNAGTFNFEYWWIDNYYIEWEWIGTYSLTADEGEEGSLFADGEDGEDKYYTLNCYALGPVLDVEYGGTMNWGRNENDDNDKIDNNEVQITVEKHKIKQIDIELNRNDKCID